MTSIAGMPSTASSADAGHFSALSSATAARTPGPVNDRLPASDDDATPHCFTGLDAARLRVMRSLPGSADLKALGQNLRHRLSHDFSADAIRNQVSRLHPEARASQRLAALLAQDDLGFDAAYRQRLSALLTPEQQQSLRAMLGDDRVAFAIFATLRNEAMLLQAEQRLLDLPHLPSIPQSWKRLADKLRAAHLDPARAPDAPPRASTYFFYSVILFGLHSPGKPLSAADVQHMLDVPDLANQNANPALMAEQLNSRLLCLQRIYNLKHIVIDKPQTPDASLNSIEIRKERNTVRQQALNQMLR